MQFVRTFGGPLRIAGGLYPLARYGRRQQKNAGPTIRTPLVISVACNRQFSKLLQEALGLSEYIFSLKMISGDDPLFSGRGSPALLSLKEPALRLLRDRYSETFAVTFTRDKKQVHLFLIKYSLWALVRTFVPKDLSSQEITVPDVLELIENALNDSENELLRSLDASVERARSRLDLRAREFGVSQKGI
jgi:hypothetical protein